jgi:hypothetical protein
MNRAGGLMRIPVTSSGLSLECIVRGINHCHEDRLGSFGLSGRQDSW